MPKYLESHNPFHDSKPPTRLMVPCHQPFLGKFRGISQLGTQRFTGHLDLRLKRGKKWLGMKNGGICICKSRLYQDYINTIKHRTHDMTLRYVTLCYIYIYMYIHGRACLCVCVLSITRRISNYMNINIICIWYKCVYTNKLACVLYIYISNDLIVRIFG